MEPTDPASMLDVDINRLKRKLEEESGYESIHKVDENGNG